MTITFNNRVVWVQITEFKWKTYKIIRQICTDTVIQHFFYLAMYYFTDFNRMFNELQMYKFSETKLNHYSKSYINLLLLNCIFHGWWINKMHYKCSCKSSFWQVCWNTLNKEDCDLNFCRNCFFYMEISKESVWCFIGEVIAMIAPIIYLCPLLQHGKHISNITYQYV